MFNKPKKNKKVTLTKAEYKAQAKKNRFSKKVDKKSKYATSFRKPKVTVTFDLDARRDFLSGFHKRKLERKAYHKAKLQKQLMEEKQKIKAQAKKSVAGVSSSHSILPEVESIIGMTNAELQLEDEAKTSTQSYIMGSKTVTISSLDSIHMKLSDMSESDSEEDIVNGNSDDEGGKPLPTPAMAGGANIKSLLKKTTNSLLVNSKAYKASQRLKQKSKRSRGKNRLIRERKRDGGAGKKETSGPSKVNTGPNKSRKGKGKVKKGKKAK